MWLLSVIICQISLSCFLDPEQLLHHFIQPTVVQSLEAVVALQLSIEGTVSGARRYIRFMNLRCGNHCMRKLASQRPLRPFSSQAGSLLRTCLTWESIWYICLPQALGRNWLGLTKVFINILIYIKLTDRLEPQYFLVYQ